MPVNTYMLDGPTTYHHSGHRADDTGPAEDGPEADGEMVRSAYTRRPNDDDFTQPALLIREVFV